MTETLDPFEHSDAAYVLGALTHEDRIAYEEHLQSCRRCSAAVAELAVLPGLLARLPALPAPMAEPEQPPETVLPGLLARMRRDRIRRRVTGAAIGVAAAALLVTGTTLVVEQTRGPQEIVGTPVAMAGDVPVSAEVRVQNVSWGTRITMTCRYDGPVPSGSYIPHSYQLVVLGTDDAGLQTVARWRALPGRPAHVDGSTDLPVDEIAGIQIRDGDGTVLLTGAP